MSPLRAFISKREREIRDQIRALKAELVELRTVKLGLEGKREEAPQEPPSQPGVTIKDMVRAVLAKHPDGLAATGILDAIKADFEVTMERTSLSPQLSRLRKSGDVVLEDGVWYPSQATLAGWITLPDDELDDFEALLRSTAEDDRDEA